MTQPVTLFTGQWADLPLDVVAEKAAAWGYDGLEAACWGDHFDVHKAVTDLDYCKAKRAQLGVPPPKPYRLQRMKSGWLDELPAIPG